MHMAYVHSCTAYVCDWKTIHVAVGASCVHNENESEQIILNILSIIQYTISIHAMHIAQLHNSKKKKKKKTLRIFPHIAFYLHHTPLELFIAQLLLLLQASRFSSLARALIAHTHTLFHVNFSIFSFEVHE